MSNSSLLHCHYPVQAIICHRVYRISLFNWPPLSYPIPTSTPILTPTDYSQYGNQGDSVRMLSQVM